ncbi:MAG: 2,3-bisphosphoglycerate-independent phosphoglycerate mutase [Alphaproteobacteria bacterium]
MSESQPQRPVVLCILDGWGHRTDSSYNAVLQANTPVWDRLLKTCPNGLLQAAAVHVGLPGGQFGNSEVGHMNIGAGRVVLQTLPRIDQVIAEGQLARNPVLEEFIAKLRESGGTCHIMGLISPAGVHAHQDHIATLVKIVTAAGIAVCIHGFLDGRDTPPESADGHVARFLRGVRGLPGFRIGTLSGRYYAMDRDCRWDRTGLVYEAVVKGWGQSADDPIAAIIDNHVLGVSDEFVKPTVLGDYDGMRDGDGVLFANFRADRIRQLCASLVDPEFDGFERDRVVKFAAALGVTEYSKRLNRFLGAMLPRVHIANTLGEVVAKAGIAQLRIAETEKYAHVTFFLNGGEEQEFAKEERILIPSPRVDTYDLKPEMSAFEITDRLIGEIESGRFGFIVANYANPDMLGHTGILGAATKAIEVVDACLGRLVDAVEKAGGVMLITADHGNAEMMRDPETGQPHTSHTHNQIPAVVVGASDEVVGLRQGQLADVAPTILALLGLEKPAEMTGETLLVEAAASHAGAAQRASA